jgi:gliding motility-associated-like protein
MDSRRYYGKPVQMITLPNAFTPNCDGVNDAWGVKNLNSYPNCTVRVYKRWRENVYSSIGCGIPWEGIYKGAVLPSGTCYYVIKLKNGLKVLSGYIAIIR